MYGIFVVGERKGLKQVSKMIDLRADELIDVGGADPLETGEAWREELANRLVRTAGLRRSVVRVVSGGLLGEPA